MFAPRLPSRLGIVYLKTCSCAESVSEGTSKIIKTEQRG